MTLTMDSMSPKPHQLLTCLNDIFIYARLQSILLVVQNIFYILEYDLEKRSLGGNQILNPSESGNSSGEKPFEEFQLL